MAAAIRGITDASVKIKQLVDEVSTSSREQTLGIEHVAKAISHTENLTQRNAAGAEDSASAAA